MKRISPSWREFFCSSRIVTIQLQRDHLGELQLVSVDGLTGQGVSRILKLVPHADGTPIDVLEAAVEVLATQIRLEIRGPPPLFG